MPPEVYRAGGVLSLLGSESGMPWQGFDGNQGGI